jgi:hypothetical protein
MEKLRATIAQYSRWAALELYIARVETHLESDFATAIENAKALLESIAKQICLDNKTELPSAPTFQTTLKKAFTSLGYTSENLVSTISGSLANIGKELGNLRNEISPTAHGKPLAELENRNNKVDLLTQEFLIDSTLVIAIFLIRAFEDRTNTTAILVKAVSEEPTLTYDNANDFNEFWDEQFDEFEMGNYSYPASEILFQVDYNAYQTEYKAFKTSEAELETGEQS